MSFLRSLGKWKISFILVLIYLVIIIPITTSFLSSEMTEESIIGFGIIFGIISLPALIILMPLFWMLDFNVDSSLNNFLLFSVLGIIIGSIGYIIIGRIIYAIFAKIKKTDEARGIRKSLISRLLFWLGIVICFILLFIGTGLMPRSWLNYVLVIMSLVLFYFLVRNRFKKKI